MRNAHFWLTHLKYLTIRLCVLIISFTLLSSSTFALTEIDRKQLYRPFYDPNSTESCVNIDLPGADNAEKIWIYLTTKGLTPPQAAGIMGNLQAESHFEPRLVQYDGINSRGEISVQGEPSSLDDNMVIDGQTGYGLAQWTDRGRQQRLHAAAVAAGTLDSDLVVQLDYLWQELAGLLQRIQALDDVAAVTSLFMLEFERPHDQSAGAQADRAQLSRDILTRFGSGTNPDSGTVVTGACERSGNIVGSFSLPVDRKWYDENPQWFTKPHHDYPAADIPVPNGTAVFSMTDGTIIVAPTSGSCGTGVIVETDSGIRYIYCHGSDGGSVPSAKQGDKVRAGQLIMHSSYTGNVQPPGARGSHLHLEIEVNGRNVCPQELFVSIVAGSPVDVTTLPTSGCTY